MATLETVVALIDEYCAKYRHPDLDAIVQSPLYDLNKSRLSKSDSSLGWPDTWPHNNRYGVYAIFANAKLLYIGKASLQSIGFRLGSYFRYGPGRHCETVINHKWTENPTHIVAWAVPDDSFFEASALEEYLIRKLGTELPDNVAGIRDA